MNKLDTKRRAQIIGCLCEGMSVAATCRITGADKKTVLRLLKRVAEACVEYHDKHVRNLKTRRVQADELWSFVQAKDKNADAAKVAEGKAGSVWTWLALDADSKLAISWFVGGRDAGAAFELMSDVEKRLSCRVQLTTDGHRAYLSAVEDVFGIGIDYAMLVKIYGENTKEDNRRYSPAVCIGAEKTDVIGKPDPKHVSTSYVERSNLSVRMHTRRFTRLTNAFSKKLENHTYAVALFYFFYNFARIHQTLRVTPAMEAGVADHAWTLEEIAELVKDEDVVILK